MPTRQTSSSGKPKSPRIQVVLPEDLCARLAALAESESRTVSNMARVLIQQGVQRHEATERSAERSASGAIRQEDRLRSALEAQQPRRLRGAPRRLRVRWDDVVTSDDVGTGLLGTVRVRTPSASAAPLQVQAAAADF